MKAKIIIALFVMTATIGLTKKTSAQNPGDWEIGKVVNKRVYPAIMIRPDQWNDSFIERDANGNIIIENNNDGSSVKDSNSVYFRMMERNKRLPSGANWDGTIDGRTKAYGLKGEYGYSKKREQ